MGVRNGKPPSPFGVILSEKANNQTFDFKICEPNIPYDDEDPVAEFLEDVARCVKKCSRLAEVDECRIEPEDSTYVAKVRIRVRASSNGSQGNATLDAAIKDLCQGLMAIRDGSRARLDILADRSIWGIIPISPVFETYWTAFFFNDILSNGPGRFQNLAEEYMQEGQPYCVPPLMVFGIATLLGMQETFHFMRSILGSSIDSSFDLPGFVMTALPTVSMVFRWLSRKAPSGKSLGGVRGSFEDALTLFKGKFDCVLDRCSTIDGNTAPTILRDLQWMHGACSELCQMSVAASELLTKKTDLLEALIEAMSHAQERATAGAMGSAIAAVIAIGEATGAATAGAATAGAATATGAGAAVLAGPLFFGGLSITAGVIAWQKYQEGVKYEEESKRVTEGA